jgi:hypothetical protein
MFLSLSEGAGVLTRLQNSQQDQTAEWDDLEDDEDEDFDV